jgi:hypothetical protein
MSITEELLEWKVAAPGLENRDERPWGSFKLTTWHSLSAEVGTNFADKLPSLGRLFRLRTKATELSFFFIFCHCAQLINYSCSISMPCLKNTHGYVNFKVITEISYMYKICRKTLLFNRQSSIAIVVILLT